jgi:hypothetical protein
MLRSAALILVLVLCPAGVQAKDFSSISVAENREIYSSVGDVLVKVTLKDSLPNVFGKADIFGRKRDRGFVEIRFMGLAPDGRAVFRRRSVEILTNETTLSPSQSLSRGSTVVQGGGYGTNIAIVGGSQGGDATVERLPLDTIEFALDLTKNRIVTVDGWQVEIRNTDAGGVTYLVSKR